ncbi:MAG: phosphoglucosamine mutase [Clostridiales bacterium]|nr:phosphoglucosamine mutase [Clostridiales bacterium]
MGRLFGTDGIRGVANSDLNCDLAFKVGQATAAILSKSLKRRTKVCIGKDTRISSDMLECALAAGLASVGADVGLLGVMPTPAVALLTVNHKYDAGIVISASHNPMEFNGIKIFNSQGFKLSDALEEEIEDLVLNGDGRIQTVTGADIGRVRNAEALENDYIEYLKGTISGDLSGLSIAVDCANGAASHTAQKLFTDLNAKCEFIFNKPDGTNINKGCGSTDMQTLRELTVKRGYDAGVAFDGDADRFLVVDETGAFIDGDRIMAVCACDLKERGLLPDNTFVATVLSNLGLHKYAEKCGLHVECSSVGDRNVLELMQKGGYALGGEQSGHVIFLNHSTTGDGQLTALQFLSILKKSGKKLSGLVSDIPQYPQIIINVKVENPLKDKVMEDSDVKLAISEVSKTLGNEGRILVRPSGTEPVIRVMVEGKVFEEVSAIAGHVADIIETVSKEI